MLIVRNSSHATALAIDDNDNGFINTKVSGTWSGWKSLYNGFCVIESVNKTFANAASEDEWNGSYVYPFDLSKTGYKMIGVSMTSSGSGRVCFVRNFWDSGAAVLSLNGKANSTGTITFRIIWAKI